MGGSGLKKPKRKSVPMVDRKVLLKFKKHLPEKFREMWGKLPDPSSPGFLALEAQLMICLQMEMLSDLGLERPYSGVEKPTKGQLSELNRWDRNRRLTYDSAMEAGQVIRQLVKANVEVTPDGQKPLAGKYTWETPVTMQTNDATGQYEVDGPGKHPPSRKPEGELPE
jgi:hypothetical protein